MKQFTKQWISYYKLNQIVSYKDAKTILERLECFQSEEINQICEAISVHSQKQDVHFPLAELLKDADVLHNYLDNPSFGYNPKNKDRFTQAMADIGLNLPSTD